MIGRRPGDWPKSKTCAECTATPRSRAALRTAFDEARLADAGFAAHDDGAAVPAVRAAVERRENHRELRPAADERLRAGADLAAQSLQAPRDDRLGLTGLRAGGARAADALAERRAQFFGDQDLAVRGARRERVCDVRRPAGERKDLGAAQHLALRDADAQRERVGDGPGRARHHALQSQRGLRRALRFVAVRSRNAEHREHVAADASIGAAAELRDRFVDATMELRRERVRFFGIELSFELQQTFEARDQDRRIEQLRPQLDAAQRAR